MTERQGYDGSRSRAGSLDGIREDIDALDALGEIRKRLISIHYELAEGPFGDRDLQRRTRERLVDLLTYVNEAIGPTAISPQSRKTRRA